MWKCARCGSTNKPNPVPGLCNRSMVTVAEFCTDKCRDEYLQSPHTKRLADIDPAEAMRMLDDIFWGLEMSMQRDALNPWEMAIYRRLKQFEIKPCKEV